MNVVIIPSWYSNGYNHVLGSFFKEQALALQESGTNITICYNEIFPIYDYKKLGILFDKKIYRNIEDGLDTYRYRNFNYLLHSNKRFDLFSKRIEKLIERVLQDKGKIDLLHFHSCFWAGICGPYIKEVFEIPYIITEHTSIHNSKQIKKSYMNRICDAYSKADKLISVSKSLKNELLQIVDREISVIHNFIDGNRFNIRDEYIKPNIIFKFFSLAFLVDGKGFEELIDACELLRNRGYEFVLEIGGDGYLRQKLENKVREKSLTDNIWFLGMLSREEVVLKMNQCDAFILASKYETFGVVYIEALACGRPIIGIKNGGFEEIINDKVGLLVNKCESCEISIAMEKIINNICSYSREYIREYFLENFEKYIIIDKLKGVYKNCLNS